MDYPGGSDEIEIVPFNPDININNNGVQSSTAQADNERDSQADADRLRNAEVSVHAQNEVGDGGTGGCDASRRMEDGADTPGGGSAAACNNNSISSLVGRDLDTCEVNHADNGNLPNKWTIVNKMTISPETYDGNTPLIDYLTHFYLVAAANKWTDDQKALHLAISLRGSAQQLLTTLSFQVRGDFTALVAALKQRFSSQMLERLHRTELRNLKRTPEQTLPELGAYIKRLVFSAYPGASWDTREMLAIEAFMNALQDYDLKLRVYDSKPETLDEAVCAAENLEGFMRAEKGHGKVHHARAVQSQKGAKESDQKYRNLEKQIEEILKKLAEIEKKVEQKFYSRTQKACYRCGAVDHFIANCPLN